MKEWIMWKQGSPLPNCGTVDIQLRDGRIISGKKVSCCDWHKIKGPADIIAYRPHKTNSEEGGISMSQSHEISEDIDEETHEIIAELADNSGLGSTEIVRAMTIGIAAVKAERDYLESEIKNRVSVELFTRAANSI